MMLKLKMSKKRLLKNKQEKMVKKMAAKKEKIRALAVQKKGQKT